MSKPKTELARFFVEAAEALGFDLDGALRNVMSTVNGDALRSLNYQAYTWRAAQNGSAPKTCPEGQESESA